MTKNSRLKFAREKSGLSQLEFANLLPKNKAGKSVNQSYIAQLEKDKGYSYKQAIVFAQVLKVLPDWLYYGNINPLNEAAITDSNLRDDNEVIYKKTEIQKLPKSNPRLEVTPLHRASDPDDWDNDGTKFEDLGDGIIRMRVATIPHKAYSGYLRGFKDPEYYEDFKLISIDVYKEHAGHYLAFEVTGDSMMTTDPALFEQMALPGWKAVGREVPRHHWAFKLHTHKTDAWIIVHNTEGILHKNIIKHNVDDGIITIHSLNPKYPDEDLALDDIAQIFSVVKYIIDK